MNPQLEEKEVKYVHVPAVSEEEEEEVIGPNCQRLKCRQGTGLESSGTPKLNDLVQGGRMISHHLRQLHQHQQAARCARDRNEAQRTASPTARWHKTGRTHDASGWNAGTEERRGHARHRATGPQTAGLYGGLSYSPPRRMSDRPAAISSAK